jgi:hypothetical protein
MTAMNDQKIAEALTAEIERAIAAGDYDRAQKLADLVGRFTERMSRDRVADTHTDGPKEAAQPRRLALIARRISTEALSAELAANRGDWQTLGTTYESLAVLFAELRLAYVRALAGDDYRENDLA